MSLLPASSIGDESTGFYNGDVEQSLRLWGTTGYLDHQFGTPTSTQKMILAFWVKPNEFGDKQNIFGGGANSTNYVSLSFSNSGFYNANDQLKLLVVNSNSNVIIKITDRLFRDPTAWMHVCVAIDTTQATAGNRVQLFFNGIRYTGGYASEHTPDENENLTQINSAMYHQIGLLYAGANYGYFDGHLADFYFLDGQSIYSDTSATINSTFLADADTLGVFCEQKNGVAIPKAYAGATSTYGNNGFRLEFKNNTAGDSSPSSSTVGADTSGKDNHFNDYGGLGTWTGNVLDCPENNFATMSPINSDSDATIDGAFRCTMGGSGNYDQVRSDFGLSSGKWYWEVYIEERGYIPAIGVMAGYTGPSTNPTHWVTFGFGAWHNTYNGGTPTYQVNQNSGGGTNWGVTMPSNGNIIMVAIDVDNNKIWWGRNGTWYDSSGTANPATGADSRVTLTSNQTWHPMLTLDTGAPSIGASNAKMRMNFGQDASFGNSLTGSDVGTETDGNGNGLFKYAPPSGYLACCSSSLPDLTIGPASATQADDHFNTVLYSGSDSGQAITGVGFQPDWHWNKGRTVEGEDHYLFDSSRGAGKAVFTTSSGGESDYGTGTDSPNRSFDADGFTVGATGGTNINGRSYVAWNWKANGGTTTTNDASATGVGTIDSVYQANTNAGFSIVTYTGTGSAGTLAHGLGTVPKFIIIKNRSSTQNWVVYHASNTSAPATDNLYLNLDSATDDEVGMFNDTAPTSTVFSIGTNANVNNNTESHVAYLFSEVEGYSKFGSYTGNNSTDGPFVFTGFRPAMIILKRSSSAAGWQILDNKRNPFNSVDRYLIPNLATYERDGSTLSPAINLDFLSNGFKVRTTEAVYNSSGGTFVYMAFAEQPFKFSNGR